MPPQTNEMQPQAFTPYGEVPKPEGVSTSGSVFPQTRGDDVYSRPGWSWGACMLSMYFVVGIRKYSYLWLYLLFFVPFVNIFAMLGIMIFFGMKGREMAATSVTFTSRDQYVGFMKAIDHAGKVFFFLTVGMIALFFIVLVSAFSLLGPGDFF